MLLVFRKLHRCKKSRRARRTKMFEKQWFPEYFLMSLPTTTLYVQEQIPVLYSKRLKPLGIAHLPQRDTQRGDIKLIKKKKLI